MFFLVVGMRMGMVVRVKNLQSLQFQVFLANVFDLFLQLVVVLLQCIVQFHKSLAFLLETLLRFDDPSVQDSTVHLQSLYHVLMFAVLMFEFMDLSLQFIFIFSLGQFQLFFKLLYLFGEGNLSERHEFFEFFGQPLFVNLLHLLFEHQFVIFQSLDLSVHRGFSLFELFDLSCSFVELMFDLLEFFGQFINFCLVFLLLPNAVLQKLLFFIAQIALKTHHFIFKQHQFAPLQFQLLFQLHGTVLPQRRTLHVHSFSFDARLEVGALSGAVRARRSVAIFSLRGCVCDAQEKVLGLDCASICLIFHRLLAYCWGLWRRLVGGLGGPQISGMLVGGIFLAGESLGDGGLTEGLIDGGICEGGEIENAGRRFLFAKVDQHRVNYNNKMHSLLIINSAPVPPPTQRKGRRMKQIRLVRVCIVMFMNNYDWRRVLLNTQSNTHGAPFRASVLSCRGYKLAKIVQGFFFRIKRSLLFCYFRRSWWLFWPVLELQQQVSSLRYVTRVPACSKMGIQIATSLAALRYSPSQFCRSSSLMFKNNWVQKALRWLVTKGYFLQVLLLMILSGKGREYPTFPRIDRKLLQTNQDFSFWKTELQSLRTCLPISSSSPSIIRNISQGLQNSLAAILKLGIARFCQVFFIMRNFQAGKPFCLTNSSTFSPVPSVEASSMNIIWQLEYSCMMMVFMFLMWRSFCTLLQLGTTTQKGSYSYWLILYFYSQQFFYSSASFEPLFDNQFFIYSHRFTAQI